MHSNIDGFLREKQVLALIPISRAKWWSGVKSGKYPQPFKLGPKTTAWKMSAIRELAASFPQAGA